VAGLIIILLSFRRLFCLSLFLCGCGLLFGILSHGFLCLFGFCGFMYTYAAYPVIKKNMIDPVVKKPAEEDEL
jgi:hypothetical protein